MKFDFLGFSLYLGKKQDDLLVAKKVVSENRKAQASSDAQKAAAANATLERSKNAQTKIEDAITQIKEENRNLTMYSVRKYSKCSINTVRKYFKEHDLL